MPFALYEKEHVLGVWHRNGSALSQVYVDKTEPDRASLLARKYYVGILFYRITPKMTFSAMQGPMRYSAVQYICLPRIT